MKHLLLFEDFKFSAGAHQVHRHKNFNTLKEELNNHKLFKDFNRELIIARKEIYKNFEGLEIKPVFNQATFYFIDLHRNSSETSLFKNPEFGDIHVTYNDQHVLLKRNGLTYSYSEDYSTKYNVSRTEESRKLINVFLNSIKSKKFTFRKEEIPAMFRI